MMPRETCSQRSGNRELKMRTLLGATIAALFITCVAAPPALLAQQKTVKECRDEWRANKDANKASGVTAKDYVAKCRGEAAQPAAAPAAAAPATPGGQAKTAKECRDEWRASKDANKAGGITQKDYVAKCRGETAQPAAAPAPTATAPAAAPAPAGEAKTAKACRDEWRANKAGGVTEKDYVAKCRAGVAATPPAAAPSAPAAKTAAPAPAPAAATAPTGANEYQTEAQAKSRCPADTVVWVNLDSKIYHFAASRNYGKTKKGAYMCEKDALAQTFRAAKNEDHP
jgi:hypothetical protein